MDNSIIFAVGGVILGLAIGFIIAKTLEKNNASKLIKR
ncbi:2',3'-cyclic-nucleotide 2'-phosphodiesterase [Algibacter lectus]|uniref:2',3'-cyclic-nucleotide 2'-phosphodiesterase n=1 Tax=Algibacter lectus TaxID=221126 RepID=A0A090WJH9_9FLAO|nr:2',3'-cyclic-nucleotide 2'-phosphodiesterase [Algibacter lectus]